MPTYRAKDEGTVIQSSDREGNVLDPIEFGKDGTITVKDDDERIAVLDEAVGAGTVELVKDAPKRKETE